MTSSPKRIDVQKYRRLFQTKTRGDSIARTMYLAAVERKLPDGRLGCSLSHVEHLIELARRGDSVAERVVKEVAARCIRGGSIPPLLEKYLIEELTAPPKTRHKPPGKNPHENDFRDFCIFYAVAELMKDAQTEGKKLSVTRNRASRDKNGSEFCLLASCQSE